MGHARLATYEPVSISLPDAIVSDADVEERMREIVGKIPTYGRAGGCGISADDKVRAVVTLKENGELLKGFGGREVTITMDDGFFPAPLVEGIIGMAEGERRSFSFEMPAVGSGDGGSRLSFMEADVRVIEVRKRKIPVPDDEWVAVNIPRAKTVAEFRANVREQMEEERRRRLDEAKRARCVAVLAGRLVGGASRKSIDRAVAGVRADFERKLAVEGKTKGGKLAELGWTESDLEASFAAEGSRIAAEGEALELMAEYWGIDVSDEEVRRTAERVCGGIAARNCLDERGEWERMRTLARCEKTLDQVVSQAIIALDPMSAANPFG